MSGRKRVASPSPDSQSTKKKRKRQKKNKKAVGGVKRTQPPPHLHADVTKLNGANSPLLRLPPELRNMVYAYVFDEEIRIDEDDWMFRNLLTLRPRDYNHYHYDVSFQDYKHHYMSLLLVCHQLHQETALLPYELALFDFGLHWIAEHPEDQICRHKHYAIREFLQKRSSVQLMSLRKLKLQEYHDRESSEKVTMEDGEHWVRELRRTGFLQ